MREKKEVYREVGTPTYLNTYFSPHILTDFPGAPAHLHEAKKMEIKNNNLKITIDKHEITQNDLKINYFSRIINFIF